VWAERAIVNVKPAVDIVTTDFRGLRENSVQVASKMVGFNKAPKPAISKPKAMSACGTRMNLTGIRILGRGLF
jgi:hypothetical protein